MRWPSGDRTASPTNRKRERSLLVKPCAPPNGASARSAAKLKMQKLARSQTDCVRERMGFSLKSHSMQDLPGHPRSPGVLRSTNVVRKFSDGEFLAKFGDSSHSNEEIFRICGTFSPLLCLYTQTTC